MTLLRELQRDALDPHVQITTVLRKARVLAARLNNAEFEMWVRHELNGYEDQRDLPKYRILSVHSKAHLILGWTQLPAADVMSSQIPEEFRRWADTSYIFAAITELASLVAGDNRPNGGLQSPWPQEIAVKFGGAGYGAGRTRVQCLRAWQDISTASIVGIIETVRNRLLEFVLQIETEAPSAGEADPGQSLVPQERVAQIFHTHISGVLRTLEAKIHSADRTRLELVR